MFSLLIPSLYSPPLHRHLHSFLTRRSSDLYVTNRQIESARIAINRHIKRGGKVWINIFPDRPLTKKPAETRMGSGKDRKSTRLNSSHRCISYAVFCLKNKRQDTAENHQSDK